MAKKSSTVSTPDAHALARAAGLDKAVRQFPGDVAVAALAAASAQRHAVARRRRGRTVAADEHDGCAMKDRHGLSADEIGAAYAARRLSPAACKIRTPVAEFMPEKQTQRLKSEFGRSPASAVAWATFLEAQW